jgi:hypothetical protein
MRTLHKVGIAAGVLFILFAGLVCFGVWWLRNGAANDESRMIRMDMELPGLMRSEAIAANLDKGGSIAYSSLGILEERKWPGAQAKAKTFLKSDDSYLWLNSAFYLAALGDKDAVPYLIKGLRHPAWRSYPKAAAYLKALTGQDYGTDFNQWKSWWQETYPDSKFDFGPDN